MCPSTEVVELARRSVGKLCSVHRDMIHGGIEFQWARVCQSDEEAEMVECELESAAVPRQPFGVSFDGVAGYRSSNQDNLQTGYLEDFRISGTPPLQHCVVRLDSPELDLSVSVEFDFSSWSYLIAPDRR